MASAHEIPQMVFWHRELPPMQADPVGELTVEADSIRIPGTLDHRNELWDRCQTDLMSRAGYRLEQEVTRLDGRYARVFDEHIEPKRDVTTGEAWLHGRFTFTMYR